MGDETSTIDQALATAYDLDQVKGDRASAVVGLRAAITADQTIRVAAEAARSKFRDVVAARSLGGQSGCHVSRIVLSLLNDALSEPG